MAKKETFQDVLAKLTGATKAIEAEAAAKTITRKKTEIDLIMADVFAIDRRLADLNEASAEFQKAYDEITDKDKALARQRLATALSNTPKALLDDRTDEGIKALRSSMEETRRGLYDAEWNNDKLPEKVTIAGKEQSIKFKDGKVKYASWAVTKRTWNIGSQLLGDVDKFGWNEIFKAGKVVEYAETQKWSIDENGDIVKEKPSQKGKGNTPPADGYALIEAAIKSLEQRLNRKDVDLTSTQGEALADKAMLAISKAVAAAKAAKK